MPEIEQDLRTATLIVAANNSLHKNMADYVCDGVNDQVEIQAAIDALPAGGGKVLLLEGTFIVNKGAGDYCIALPNNTSLVGTGSSTTVIRMAANSDCHVISNSDTVGGNSNITIRDLFIDGNKSGQGLPLEKYGINFSNVINGEARSVYVKDTCASGIRSEFSSYISMIDCIAEGTGDDAFAPNEETFYSKVIGCLVINTSNDWTEASNGIEIQDGAHDIEVIGNIILNAYGEGIEVSAHPGKDACYNIVIDSNVIRDAGANGIDIGGRDPNIAHHIIVSNNVITDSTAEAILVFDFTEHISVLGNTIQYTEDSAFNGVGIDVMRDGSNLVQDNVLIYEGSGDATTAIQAWESPYISVIGNLIKGWDTGIHFGGAGGGSSIIAENSILEGGGIAIWLRVGAAYTTVLGNVIQYAAATNYAADIIRVEAEGCAIKDNFILDEGTGSSYGIHALENNITVHGNTLVKSGVETVAVGIKVENSNKVSVVNNNLKGWGYIGIQLYRTIDSCLVANNIVDDVKWALHCEGTFSNIAIKNNIFTNLASGWIPPAQSKENLLLFEGHSDLFMDILAASTTHLLNAQDVSAYAGGETPAVAAQPDVPRNLTVTAFDNAAGAPVLTMTVIITGVDAKGNAVTETFETSGSETKVGDIAFATVSQIEVDVIAGNGAGDTLSVGIGSKLGLSNIFYATGDVYKCTKNGADYSGAGNITPDITYHTVDVSTGGAIVVGDDYTIWFRSNLNLID